MVVQINFNKDIMISSYNDKKNLKNNKIKNNFKYRAFNCVIPKIIFFNIHICKIKETTLLVHFAVIDIVVNGKMCK